MLSAVCCRAVSAAVRALLTASKQVHPCLRRPSCTALVTRGSNTCQHLYSKPASCPGHMTDSFHIPQYAPLSDAITCRPATLPGTCPSPFLGAWQCARFCTCPWQLQSASCSPGSPSTWMPPLLLPSWPQHPPQALRGCCMPHLRASCPWAPSQVLPVRNDSRSGSLLITLT